MPSFRSNGVTIAYEVHGQGPPILLVHGFGSNGRVNWVDTGWVETLIGAGYSAVTIDNRGHGESQKLYDAQLYYAHEMAEDAAALLDHLGIARAALLGYSMGARIAAFLAIQHPERVACSIWGGAGMNLVDGLSDSEEIISALTAETLTEVTHPVGRQFRIFADHTRSDRAAMAACMVNSREPIAEAALRTISTPVLVATGSEDRMAGSGAPLAALLPNAEAVVIERRDHMRATGDPQFKRAALAFLARHYPVDSAAVQEEM